MFLTYFIRTGKARHWLALLVFLGVCPALAAVPDFPFRTPDRPDWWRREVPRGRLLDADLQDSLMAAAASLPMPDWGRALSQPGHMSVWDLGADADGFRHVGFRGNRRFEKGEDPREW